MWVSDDQWYPTGLLASDDTFTERRVKIEPPLVGNKFRVITNKEHTEGGQKDTRWTFDLLATKVLDE